MSDTWLLEETAFTAKTARAYEGMFTQGSGYLQIRGSLEEHLEDAPQNVSYTRKPANVTAEKFPETKARWGTYVPGVFAPHPLLNSEMVNLPWFLDMVPALDGEKLDVERGSVTAYTRTLDLRSAVLSRSLTWSTRSGCSVEVRFERFVSARRPGLCLQRLTLTSDRAARLDVRAGIDADVRTNGHDHFVSVNVEALGPDGASCIVVTDGGDTITTHTRLYGASTPWEAVSEPRRVYRTLTCDLQPGRPTVLEKRTAVATSRDLQPGDAAGALAAADPLDWDALLAEHTHEWEARWERCDVQIDGDDASQLALRFSIHHLLRAHVPDDRVAIGAKGHAGDAYRGRYYWDTEVYLLPFYLYTEPERARTLVDFRVRTLPGAARNAALYGYRGARYPWESDAGGQECCANWQYCDHEVHVTADVVYGLHHYAAAAEPAYLSGPAREVLFETARYWMERIDWRPGEEHPSLLGVMGPDEYCPISHNSAYTNRLVALNLDLAARVGAPAGVPEDERRAWRATAAALPLPRSPDGRLVLQCEDFELLSEPHFERHWPDRTQPYAAQVSQERLYRSKCLKQADVLLLMALFPHEYSDEEVRAAWDYYLPYTTHDSSLSKGIHAIVGRRLGLHQEAWDYWRGSAFKDLEVEHGGAAEGIHIAGCGANWQVAVQGFAGFFTALQAEHFTLDPCLPEAWHRMAFRLLWHGTPVAVELTHHEARVTNLGASDLAVCVASQTATVRAGGSAAFELAPSASRKDPSDD